MAKTETHLKFAVGDHFLTVEGGSGYVADADPPMYDTVNLAVRAKNASGGVGGIFKRSLYVHREQLIAIGLNFLDIASRMTPRTLWARSNTVGCSHQEPTIYHLVEEDRKALESIGNDELKSRRVSVRREHQNMRRRVHTLQRCQRLVEMLPDNEAAQLDLLLAAVEAAGTLPFRFELMPVADGVEVPLRPTDSTKH